VFKIQSSNSTLVIIIQVEDPLGGGNEVFEAFARPLYISLETHLFALAVYFQKQKKYGTSS